MQVPELVAEHMVPTSSWFRVGSPDAAQVLVTWGSVQVLTEGRGCDLRGSQVICRVPQRLVLSAELGAGPLPRGRRTVSSPNTALLAPMEGDWPSRWSPHSVLPRSTLSASLLPLGPWGAARVGDDHSWVWTAAEAVEKQPVH